MKTYLTCLISACMLLSLGLHSVTAQSYRSLVNGGNELFSGKKYDDAEVAYQKSLQKNPERIEGYFNLGNTLYRKGDYKNAMEQYSKGIVKVTDSKEAARSLYNIGNSFLDAAEKASNNPAAQQLGDEAGKAKMEGYTQAAKAYKQSLKIDPKDEDARYNLAYAMKKLEELKQQQNQKNDQQKNQDKKQKQDQEKQNKQDQQNKNDQQKQDQQKQQQNQNEQDKGKESEAEKQRQQEQQKNQMSKQQAERILDALKNDEKELQKKIKAKIRARVQVEKDW